MQRPAAWWRFEGSLPFVAERVLAGWSPGLYGALRRLRGRPWERPVPLAADATAPDAATKVTPGYCIGVFEHHARHAPAEGAVLELGPGSSLGPCSLFAARGREAVALDRFAWEHDSSLDELYAQLGTEGCVPRREIGPAEDMPFADRSFAFVYSHATFEHLLDPDAVIRETARVLGDDGVTSHQVDAGDHRHRDRPLEYLRVPRWAWEAMFRDREDYQNRWRLPEYERAFRKHFHEVECHVAVRVEPQQLGDRRRFARPYRRMAADELAAIDFQIVARRPRR